MLLHVVLPPEVSIVDLDGKYGFVVSPISKNAETALVCQILWQLPPANHQVVSHILQNLIKFHYIAIETNNVRRNQQKLNLQNPT